MRSAWCVKEQESEHQSEHSWPDCGTHAEVFGYLEDGASGG
jgi:hypothetical protein